MSNLADNLRRVASFLRERFLITEASYAEHAANEIELLRALTACQTHGCAFVKITADDYGDVKADLILEDFWRLELLNDSADEKDAP